MEGPTEGGWSGLMISPEGKNLIFILSAPRAGSTLLGALLSNKGQAVCPGEPWIQLTYAATARDQALVDADYDQTLANAAIEQFWGESIPLEKSLKTLIARRYTEIAREAGCQVLIDKTPRYYHIAEFLAHKWPQARFVWMKRSPLDIVASCKSHWHVSVAEQMGAPPGPHGHDCTTAFFNLTAFFAKRPKAPQVKYEDLVSDQGQSLGRVCQKLELSTPSPTLKYARPQLKARSEGTFRFGDDKIWQHQSAHRQSIGKWKTVLERSEVNMVLSRLGRPCFEDQGYGNEYDEALVWIGGSLDENLPDPSPAKSAVVGHFAIDRKLTAAVSEIQTLRDQLAELSKALIDSCNEKDTVIAQRNEAQAREADLLRKFKLSEADREERAKVIQKQGLENSKLGAEFEKLQDELHSLYEELDTAIAQRNLLKAQLEDLQRNFDAIERDRLERGREINRQGQEMADLQAEFANRLKELSTLYETTEQLTNTNNLIRAQFENLENNLKATEADRSARAQVIENQGRQVAELQKMVWLTEQDRDYWKNQSISGGTDS